MKLVGGKASNSFLGALAGLSSAFSSFLAAFYYYYFLGYYLSYYFLSPFFPPSFLSALIYTHSFLVTNGYLNTNLTPSKDNMCLYHLNMD